MRILRKAVFGLALFVFSVLASAADCAAVAYVNISHVMQQVGYDRLYLLGVDPEIRKELRALEKQKEALTRELIAAKDHDGVKAVTERMRLLETKHSMLAKNARNNSSRDMQNKVKAFIAETYGKRYGLILTRRLEDDTSAIHQSLNVEQLTDKVVQDLSAAIDSLD